jgi:hypothetical protein
MSYDEMNLAELRREIKERGLEVNYLSDINLSEALDILWRDDQGQGVEPLHNQKRPKKERTMKFWWKRATLTIPVGTRVYLAESGEPTEITTKLRTKAKIACSKNGARFANEFWIFIKDNQMYHLRPTEMFGVLIENENVIPGP